MEPLSRWVVLEDGVVRLRPGGVSKRTFWRLRTRSFNILAVLRLSGRLDGIARLSMPENPVVSLTPLSGLAALRSLSLLGDAHALLDLSPLSDLVGLEALTLQRAQITDLSPLVGLKGLKTLVIREAGSLTEAWPLVAMSGLTRLELGGCAGLRPRRERSMMPDAVAVRRYRAKIARALSQTTPKTRAQQRWLAAAKKEGLLARSVKPARPSVSMKRIRWLMCSQEPAIAQQGLELLLALSGDDLAEVVKDPSLFRGMLGAPSLAVRRRGIRLLLDHAAPEHVQGLADGISLDSGGHVVLQSGVARRGYLQRTARDPSVALALLRAAGRLDGVSALELRPSEQLSEVAGIAGLTGLHSLDIGLAPDPDTAAGMMAGIATLRGLEFLRLRPAERLESTALLGNLPKLSTLHIRNARDLRDLSGLFQVRDLSIQSAVSLQDLHALSTASELRRLTLYIAPRLSDLSPLSGLTQLRALTLVGCDGVVELSPLSGLRRLEHLELQGLHGVRDITPLAGLSSLKALYLRCGRIDDLSPLSSLTALENLSLTRTAAPLPSLAGSSSLTTIRLIQCEELVSLSVLSSLASLQYLEVKGAPLASLAGLLGLSVLEQVTVADCAALTDIAALDSLPALKRLTIENCPSLKALDSLAGCSQLETLRLSRLGVYTPRSTYGRGAVKAAISALLSP